MFEPKYVREILLKAQDCGYAGVTNLALLESVTGEKLESINSNDIHKFKYHMDEAWEAGFLKFYEVVPYDNWGYDSDNEGISICVHTLILTPLGNEVLKALSKPKGLEILVDGIKKAGAIGSSESFKYGISHLLNGISGGGG